MDNKGTFKVALEKIIRTGCEFLNCARKIKGFTVTKVFDSFL